MDGFDFYEFLDRLNNNSSDSSSDDESIFSFTSAGSSAAFTSYEEQEPPPKRHKPWSFSEEVETCTDEEFKKYFRLGRAVAETLIDKYKVFITKENHGGRVKVGANTEIYLMLWYLTNSENYCKMAERFKLTISSVYRILNRVMDWIVSAEFVDYIQWPTDNEMKSNQRKFLKIKGFPRVVGAIGATHIRIHTPTRNRMNYYNSNNYYSILLQAIVGPDKKFIDVHSGEPGAMSTADLFHKSHFFSDISETPDLIIPGGVLLGDSAYPDEPYLITPFQDFGNLTAKEKSFNCIHLATRKVADNAFDLLRARFRRLKFFECSKLGFVSNCIVTTCILHNICIDENDIEVFTDVENNPNDDEDSVMLAQDSCGFRDEFFSQLDKQHLFD